MRRGVHGRLLPLVSSWVADVFRAMSSAGLIALFALGAGACGTRENAARKQGREAALFAARACDADAGDVEACREPICRERCTSFADCVRLDETCTTKCMGQGTCDSDADCTGGLVCVMIAPRLRRCQPYPDATP